MDSWDRNKVEGYGIVEIPHTPGFHEMVIRTFKPDDDLYTKVLFVKSQIDFLILLRWIHQGKRILITLSYPLQEQPGCQQRLEQVFLVNGEFRKYSGED